MGKESRADKVRYCPACKQLMYLASEAFKLHLDTCQRLHALGLITPQLIVAGRGGG